MGKGKSIGILILCISSLLCTTSLYICASSLFFGPSALVSQETDPFYLRLLSQGEKSLLAKHYREAIKELEIAAFGLHKEEKLKAKALVYLGMCHYYLRDMEKCEKYMRQAYDLVGREEIASLEKEIDESLRGDFKKLLNRLKLATPEEKEEPPKPQEKPEKTAPKAKKPAQEEKPKTEAKR